MRKNFMSGALRIDELTLAGFDMTLRLHVRGEYRMIPMLRMLCGGGALPELFLETHCDDLGHAELNTSELERRLKGAEP